MPQGSPATGLELSSSIKLNTMKWIESHEERQERAERKRQALQMAREDFARGRKEKDPETREQLFSDANSRVDRAISKNG